MNLLIALLHFWGLHADEATLRAAVRWFGAHADHVRAPFHQDRNP